MNWGAANVFDEVEGFEGCIRNGKKETRTASWEAVSREIT